MPKPTPTGRRCPKCEATDPPRYARGQCAICALARANARYKRDPDSVKASSAAWRKANPERKAALSAAWAKANPEKVRASGAAWTRANPEKIAAWRRANPDKVEAWRRANPERAAAISAAWVKRNRGRVAANKAAWAKANPEKIAAIRARRDPKQAVARMAAWRRANPEKFALQNRQGNKRRRAALAGVVCVDYLDVDIFERDGWLCHLCDEPIDPSLSRMDPLGATVDHVMPISRGGDYVAGNSKAAHRRCNVARGNRSVEWARARLVRM